MNLSFVPRKKIGKARVEAISQHLKLQCTRIEKRGTHTKNAKEGQLKINAINMVPTVIVKRIQMRIRPLTVINLSKSVILFSALNQDALLQLILFFLTKLKKNDFFPGLIQGSWMSKFYVNEFSHLSKASSLQKKKFFFFIPPLACSQFNQRKSLNCHLIVTFLFLIFFSPHGNNSDFNYTVHFI